LNPTLFSRFNPFDDLAKKTSPVKPRFNPFDVLKNKSPSKKKPTGDVSKVAKPAEFEVNVQGKASVDQGKETNAVSKAAKPAEFEVNVQGKVSVDQGKETSTVISAVVADLVKENGMDTEKKLLRLLSDNTLELDCFCQEFHLLHLKKTCSLSS
jgi:hypothetical protein